MPCLLSIAAFALAAATPREWLVTFTDRDSTQLVIRMTADVGPARWELYSRPGAVNEMINWRQRLLGTLLRKLPPHGALLTASGTTTASGDSVLLRGVMESQFLGRQFFVGSMRGNQLRAELRFTSDTGAVAGTIVGTASTSTTPVRDYRAIAANVRRTITDLVFDASIPQRPNMQAFLRQFDEAAARATDDLDLVGSFVALRPLIGISHFEFIRNPRLASTPLDSLIAGDAAVDPSKFVRLQFYGAGAMAYLRVDRWDRVSPYVHRAFERMDSAHTKALILDLRGNRGGDASAFSPAMHLYRDSVFVGGVVGRPWFATHHRPPTPDEMRGFPAMNSELETHRLLDYATRIGGAYGKVGPQPPYFGGPVYLLVDRNSGSASETIIYLLESTHRATLIGERTPGALLTALPHPVGDGFVVTVPEADYYAADGTRIEGRGIDVGIHAEGGEALIVAGKKVVEVAPYAGWQWLGYSYNTLRRYDESEAAWNKALEVAPSEASKRAIRERIEAVRKAKAGKP